MKFRAVEQMAENLERCANPAADAILDQMIRTLERLIRQYESLPPADPASEFERRMILDYGPGPDDCD